MGIDATKYTGVDGSSPASIEGQGGLLADMAIEEFAKKDLATRKKQLKRLSLARTFKGTKKSVQKVLFKK